jgi:exodeoxyribonuclease V alpha subunit
MSLVERLAAAARRDPEVALPAAFVRTLAGLHADAADDALLAAALASAATTAGHTCIDVARMAGTTLLGGVGEAPPLGRWLDALRTSELVGAPGTFRPLILDGTRVYLHRYFAYETGLAADLRAMAAATVSVNEAVLARGLDRLFGAGSDPLQRRAAETAVRRRVAVVSGGPGTGKTTTVAKLLALLIEQAGATLSVALAAPTGKAAARLQAAIGAARAGLALPAAVDDVLPGEATTLHRLLGLRPGHATPRYDRDNPLPCDVLVVDEASMIDIASAAKLVRALSPHARLVLLGDKDQLASVEAGAVLASLCAGLPADNVVLLERSFRFRETSGIGRLAARVREGDAAGAQDVLAEPSDDLVWHRTLAPREIVDRVMAGYAALFAAAEAGADAGVLFAALERFRVLCAVRGSAYGVRAINRAVVDRLGKAGERHFVGQPLLVTRNDYGMRLFNGDIGVVVGNPDGPGLAVAFPVDGGGFRHVATGRLPDTETVYAMTVHKSQGSEFEDALFVLPPEAHAGLCRELVYTAVTRARSRLDVAAAPAVLAAAVATPTARDSQLAARLRSS